MKETKRSIIRPIITALLSVCMVICFIFYASKGFVNDKVTPVTEQVNTVSGQITAINGSIDELKAADTELNDYIDALETAVATLETDLAATNAKITEFEESIEETEYATITQLTETKTALEGQIATANTAIDTLKAADTTQNSKISALETAKASLESEIAAIKTRLDIVEGTLANINSCTCDTSLYATKEQLNEAKTALEGQLATVNTAITALQTVNGELDTAITALETSVGALEDELETTKTTIETVKAELEEAIEAVETTVLAQLNTLKTSTESDIATLKADVAALKTKDTELTNKITALETTVATLASKDWANATFATLEQYTSVQTTISGIEQEIDDVNASVTALETKLNSKIATDITAAINALRTELSDDYVAKITAATNSITTAYTGAIATAKTEITSAYTAAISSAISTSETSMKAWVNETLANGYYDIATIDAKLAALEMTLAVADSELATDIAQQQAALEKAKTDLTSAYQTAIETAINENNGEIDTKIANDIETAKTELNASITAIELRVATLELLVEQNSDKIAELEQKIEELETKINCLAGVHIVEIYTINDDGTHTFTCTACQETITEEHDYVDYYECECGDKIEITSLSLIIDDVEYDSANTSASNPARVGRNSNIKIKLYGTNLDLIKLSHSVKYKEPYGLLIDVNDWTFNDDDTEATQKYGMIHADVDEQTSVYQIKYKNPNNSYVDSGVYYLYYVEAKWGADVNSLDNEGTLVQAVSSGAAYIQLQRNFVLTQQIEFPSSITTTVDLNTYTVTAATNKDAFYNNGTLTILNGTIVNDNYGYTGVLNNGTMLKMEDVVVDGYNPFVQRKGTAELERCTFKNEEQNSMYSAAICVENGNITATDCSFIGKKYGIYVKNCLAGYTATITLKNNVAITMTATWDNYDIYWNGETGTLDLTSITNGLDNMSVYLGATSSDSVTVKIPTDYVATKEGTDESVDLNNAITSKMSLVVKKTENN